MNQSPDLHALTAALAPDWRVFEDDCAAVRQRPALSLPTDSGVFIYGAGRFGRDVAAALQDQGQGVLGFIDRRSSGAPVDGLASWTLPQVASRLSGQTVWVAVFNREAPLLGIAQQLLAAGARQVCMPWDFYPLVAAKLGWRYWLSGPEEILQNLDAIGRTYQRLADSTSQQRLVDVCRFRLGLQLAYSQFVDPQPQYFNELTLPRPDQPVRYVDAGAFNGDTYLALKSQARVDEAWLFEPDPQNYRLLVQAIKGASVVHALPLALSDGYHQVAFSVGGGEAAPVQAQHGAQTDSIATCALDDVLGDTAVNLIKLDVEGAEREALLGMRQALRRHRPALAISAYHRPSDVWALVDVLAETLEGYRFHLRQHFYNSFELVLYAIPIH